MSLDNPAPDGAAILAELKTRAAALDFPLQLREHPWWVNWFPDAEGHKLPTYKRKTGITKDQPGPFLTYGAACELDGARLSFVPRPTNPLRCLDLDGCRDHATGELTPGARKVVDHFAPTYWEVSPSGRGLHGWLDAPEIAASFTVHVDGQKVEVFADTNHCTMTGTALDDCREVMRDPAAGDWLRLHADGETIPEGERDATFTRLAGGWFHDFEDADDFAAHCRERNLARCDPPMSKAQVDKIVKSILKREGKKADKNAAASADLDAKVTAFNATFGLVLNLGVVETRGTPIFHNVAKFRLFYQGERLGRQSIADAWLGHPQCRKYFDVVFDPTRAPFATVQSPRGAVFNLWPGFAVAPAEGDCTLFLSHVREIICAGDPERARWVENWLAHMVQRPEILPGTALVLRSAQGAGKTLVGEVLGKLLGDALFCEVSKASELTGDFNSHHQRKLLIMVEEAFWAGDKAAADAAPRGPKGSDARTPAPPPRPTSTAWPA